jgi:hypothetical protein
MQLERHTVKNVAMVLCSAEWDSLHIERVIKNFKYKFPSIESVVLCSDAKIKNACPKISLELIENIKFWEYKVVLLILGSNQERIAQDKIDYNLTRVYEADSFGMIRYTKQILDEIEYPHHKTHFFNEVANNLGNERLCYFPYNYISQYVGLGPINEFGHRIDCDLETLQTRDESTKLIIVMGGSAGWSTYCNFDEMFSQRLEVKLNSQGNTKKNYKVLNFSQPSAVTLNNIFDYILFVQKLKPDLIILHAGCNDFAFGQKSDSYLLGKYQLAYQFQFESWAKILERNSNEKEIDASFFYPQAENYPRTIFKAFLDRLNQFELIASATNSNFLFGLQPMSFSKKRLSNLEKKYIVKNGENFFKPILNNMKFLYDEFTVKILNMINLEFIDFHNEFRKFDEDMTMFVDQVHTLPVTDEIIADIYFQELIKRGLV